MNKPEKRKRNSIPVAVQAMFFSGMQERAQKVLFWATVIALGLCLDGYVTILLMNAVSSELHIQAD